MQFQHKAHVAPTQVPRNSDKTPMQRGIIRVRAFKHVQGKNPGSTTDHPTILKMQALGRGE